MSEKKECPKCAGTSFIYRKKGPHNGKYCADCDSWVEWVKTDRKSFIWPIGAKHK